MDKSETKKIGSQTLQECYEKQMKYTPSDRRRQKFDKAIMCFLIEDMRPWGPVEGEGYQNLIRTIDTRLTIKSRTTLSREKLPSLYQGTLI